jgi:hypothetical protein
MRINPFVYGVLVLVLFLGTLGGFKAAGIWSISGKLDTAGEKVTADGSDVTSLKGWMTLGEVTQAFNVPLDELLQHFNLPADTDPAAALKDLESETFDITALREWLTARQQETSAVLGTAPAEPAAPVSTATPDAGVELAPVEPTPTVHAAADRTITGQVTFQQVLDWGVSKEAIEKVIGGSIPAASKVIKDYVTGQGKEFPDIKAALQTEVDQVQ